MAAIQGVSWNSVWTISGNVLDLRYKLLCNQLQCATHLENLLNAAAAEDRAFLEDLGFLTTDGNSNCEGRTLRSTPKPATNLRNGMHTFGTSLQRTISTCWQSCRSASPSLPVRSSCGCFFPHGDCKKVTPLPHNTATESDAKEENKDEASSAETRLAPYIQHAEQLVCYVYLGFIQNVLGRMRTLVVSIVCLFIAATISLACYPFDPRTVVNAVMVLLFLILSTVIVTVYAQMHRDPILSMVTNTKPGELDGEFWLKLISFGAAPVLSLLATIFPEMTEFLFSWVAPGISSMK